MNCKASRVRKGLLICCLITFAGLVWWNYNLSKEMVRKNTRIINLLTMNAMLQTENSDIIMDVHKQFLALDGEPTLELIPMEPEVAGLAESQPKTTNESAKNSMKQVVSDLNDIEALTQALASNQLFQKQSLQTILERVRELVQKELKKTEIKEDKEPLKNVYRTLYGSQDMKIISDKKLDNFRWSFVPLKDK